MERADVAVTVLTCTYNRRHTLGRLHESLLQQTFRNFEWLVVDDGSTDGTADLIREWQRADPDFPIRYSWKPNGGKHSAHNHALPLLRGEYCAIIDSDDWYPPTALADLVEEWRRIGPAAAPSFANVEGLTQTGDGVLIGSPFPADVFDSDNFSIRRLRKVQGDTRGMYRVAVLKEFPFPEAFEGQFVQEALIWHRVARRYRTRFVNRIVGYTEYLPGGLSDLDVHRMLRSLRPRLLLAREMLEQSAEAPLAYRAKLHANYLRLSIHDGTLLRALHDGPSALVGMLVLPASLALFARDKVHRWRSRSGLAAT
jgi:glycosyltransferase involved in cell wall biosynthesis